MSSTTGCPGGFTAPGAYRSWNWGDGSPIEYGPIKTHTYSLPGFYTITLIVHDACGGTDSDTAQVW